MICLPIRCFREEFKQLYSFSDPVSGEDIHYKLFEELYGIPITEEIDPCSKMLNYRKQKGDNQQSNNQQGNKQSDDQLSDNQQINQAKSKQDKIQQNNDIIELSYLFTESSEFIEVSDENTNNTVNKKTSKSKNRSEKNFTKVDSIYKLFQYIFVNNSWSCALPIEKPYYSAEIFPVICFLYENRNVIKLSKGECPLCAGCSKKSLPKKML
ncbi:11113_t:CDS:2 [Gigaspora margarita]|uniref:11113_t:CDS:1 n=1 Tax=Gigaspora margarita TaxID=4874 RepID=A0ABN7UT19_GIGMA|nr:11113_t:CDS:2 [Gigaspora margarita]